MKIRSEIKSYDSFLRKVKALKRPWSKFFLYLTDKYTFTKDGFRIRSMNLEDIIVHKIIKRYKINISVLCEMADLFSELSWKALARHQVLSWEFIEDFKNELDFDILSKYQNLHINTLIRFEDCLNWNIISQYQKLTPDIIRKFSKRLNWKLISRHQRLSEDIIEENIEKINWLYISLNQKISAKFIEKHKEDIKPGILYDNFLIRRSIKKRFIKFKRIWSKPNSVGYYFWKN